MEKTVLVELTSKQIKLDQAGRRDRSVCAVCLTPCRIRTPLHRRSARAGIFSSYVTVFRRLLSGANLSLVEARITAVHSF